jgi:hypothetical protein
LAVLICKLFSSKSAINSHRISKFSGSKNFVCKNFVKFRRNNLGYRTKKKRTGQGEDGIGRRQKRKDRTGRTGQGGLDTEDRTGRLDMEDGTRRTRQAEDRTRRRPDRERTRQAEEGQERERERTGIGEGEERTGPREKMTSQE